MRKGIAHPPVEQTCLSSHKHALVLARGARKTVSQEEVIGKSSWAGEEGLSGTVFQGNGNFTDENYISQQTEQSL